MHQQVCAPDLLASTAHATGRLGPKAQFSQQGVGRLAGGLQVGQDFVPTRERAIGLLRDEGSVEQSKGALGPTRHSLDVDRLFPGAGLPRVRVDHLHLQRVEEGGVEGEPAAPEVLFLPLGVSQQAHHERVFVVQMAGVAQGRPQAALPASSGDVGYPQHPLLAQRVLVDVEGGVVFAQVGGGQHEGDVEKEGVLRQAGQVGLTQAGGGETERGIFTHQGMGISGVAGSVGAIGVDQGQALIGSRDFDLAARTVLPHGVRFGVSVPSRVLHALSQKLQAGIEVTHGGEAGLALHGILQVLPVARLQGKVGVPFVTFVSFIHRYPSIRLCR